MYYFPPTGDEGLNPIVLVLLIVCSVILIGCIIWTVVLNHKNSRAKTSINTITEEDMVETTVVEDIATESVETPSADE